MKSAQHPWLRAGLLGPIPFLLPFVWVFEISSCGGGREEGRTGLSLLGEFGVEQWAVIAPVLLGCVAAPFLARALARPVARLVVQLLGLTATLLLAYGSWLVLFFSIFTTRVLRAAGLLVAVLVGLTCVDAVVRFALAAREWLAARRSPP